MSAMAVVLFGFSVLMPFLAIIGIGFSVGSIVAFAKAWELFAAGASSAVDRANAKLAKEKLKELKRERKAENALANEQKEQAERTVTKNKNQKQIDSLNEENVAIDARIAMLENQKRALIMQNALLLPHGRQADDFKKLNLDEANMSEEEKEQYRTILATITLEEDQQKLKKAQNEEDFKIPHGERAQRHKENLYETVENLQNNKLEYEKAQKAYSEAEAQIPIETQKVEELGKKENVVAYLNVQSELKKLKEEREERLSSLTSLTTDTDKKLINNKIKEIDKKVKECDGQLKTLEKEDKDKNIEAYYNHIKTYDEADEARKASKKKMEELKAEREALVTKKDTQLAVVVNDSMVEAHKDDKKVISDKKRMATVKINDQLVNALDSEIAELQKLKEQNKKLSTAINKRKEKEDFAKQVKESEDKYSRRVTSQQKLTKKADEYLTDVSDVTKAEQQYMNEQREEAIRSADLILQGYNLAAEKGIEGEALQKWLDDIDLNISNMKRTSPREFSDGYDKLKEQGKQRFAGKVHEKAPVRDAKSEKASAKA